jgi:hypothetical protein
MRRIEGVALVLVLMVVGVLSLLLLQLSLTARQQVKRAQQVLDRSEAVLRLHSIEAAIRFELLTRPWALDPNREGGMRVSNLWNFRGIPFEFVGATVCLQDVAGLIPLPAQRGDLSEFTRLLSVLGMTDDRVALAVQRLRSHMDSSGWMPLQSAAELAIIMSLTSDEMARLNKISTLYPSTAFNPLTAPASVLATRYSTSAIEAVEALRAQGQLDETTFSAATGVQFDDFIVANPGPVVRVDIRVLKGESIARRQTVWRLEPRSMEPLVLWSARSPAEGEGDPCRT